MMKDRKLLSLMVVSVLLIALGGTIWALNGVYNRPEPLMDYAPQEIGIYDTRYDHLGELDCRGCHGSSLADRHHYSETVIVYGLCTPCHEIIPDPPGVVVIRDCTVSGCHSWDDVETNGWHHNTNLSASENCVACHDRNLVAEITPLSTFAQYPPSVVTPTPFSCENCHWEQDVVTGHPSTYDHYDQWGNFIGYYEYGKPVLGNYDTHHMGNKGNVASQCWKCHSNDPADPSWDPYDPELIRYCEICHDIATLHTIEPHVGSGGTGDPPAVDGWEAVGFHVAGSSTSIPTTYRTFYANEQCIGCHGDLVEPWDQDPNMAPHIDAIAPTSVCPTGIVELTGYGFGEEWIPGQEVQLKLGTNWVSVPVYSWTETRIEFEVPAWTFSAANYKVRVFCDDRSAGRKKSNTLNVTILDCASPKSINGNMNPAFDSGACKEPILLENGTGNFGTAQDQVPPAANGDGIYHVVEIVSSQSSPSGDDPVSRYIAMNVLKWTNNKVKFRFKDFFKDEDGDFLYDVGEPMFVLCEGLGLGEWDIYLKYIFYNDTDGSVNYSDGDTLYQVETSNPVTYELTNQPYITQLNPQAILKGEKLKIYGINFGPTQTDGEVRIGTKNQYEAFVAGDHTKGKVLTRIRRWSNTRIKVKMRIPIKWSGKTRHIWVVKNGMPSNRRKIEIL